MITWVLFSLIIFLLLSTGTRAIEEPLSALKVKDGILFIICFVCWPVGFFIWLILMYIYITEFCEFKIIKFLVKERKIGE